MSNLGTREKKESQKWQCTHVSPGSGMPSKENLELEASLVRLSLRRKKGGERGWGGRQDEKLLKAHVDRYLPVLLRILVA